MAVSILQMCVLYSGLSFSRFDNYNCAFYIVKFPVLVSITTNVRYRQWTIVYLFQRSHLFDLYSVLSCTGFVLRDGLSCSWFNDYKYASYGEGYRVSVSRNTTVRSAY